MKKLCCAVIFAAGTLALLPAATVSVLVVETGLPPGTKRTGSAAVWESGVMDACFDAGHIVSNAPVLRVERAAKSELPPEARRDFDEARIGGADFFVMVLLAFPGAPAEESGGAQPREISIMIFRVASGELIYEASVQSRAWESLDEEFADAKKNAGKIIPRLKG